MTESEPQSKTKPLASQVGGHAGVQTSEDGALLIKPALPLERQFYDSINSDPNSPFSALKPYIPEFFGVLKLEGQVDEGNQLKEVEGVVESEKESLVLFNLSSKYKWPNILDIKLGTVLYDETASPEKVERMKKTAADTTSLETGIRLTGFQVYDRETGEAVNTPKAYGKSITVAQLPEGIAKFFPFNPAQPNIGLDEALVRIRDDIQAIRDVLAGIEMRMVGGSLLVVYEANPARAAADLAWTLKKQEEGSDDEEESEEEEDTDADDDDKRATYISTVKLIDFAHTRHTPGEGPDEGVLLGIDNVLKLLAARHDEIVKTQTQ